MSLTGVLEDPKSEFELLRESVERYRLEKRRYYYEMQASKETKDKAEQYFKEGYILECKRCNRGLWEIIIQILY